MFKDLAYMGHIDVKFIQCQPDLRVNITQLCVSVQGAVSSSTFPGTATGTDTVFLTAAAAAA